MKSLTVAMLSKAVIHTSQDPSGPLTGICDLSGKESGLSLSRAFFPIRGCRKLILSEARKESGMEGDKLLYIPPVTVVIRDVIVLHRAEPGEWE